MDSRSRPIEIPVQLSGFIASKILKDAIEGRVAAVFRSSFYAETDHGHICIGNETHEPSPLSLVTMAPARTDWSACGLQRDAEIHFSRTTMTVGGRFSFLHSGADDWVPSPISNSPCVEDLSHGLKDFRTASRGLVPEDGLGSYLIPGYSPPENAPIARAACPQLTQARHWLVSAMRDPEKGVRDLHWVRRLIGLGPGLTPSGDDVIGGVMIALHCVGEPGICMRLWERVHPHARKASNPISHALLSAASQGQGSAGIHCAVSAILQGREHAVRDSLAAIDRIGHTSGWDTMIGVAMAFDAWLQAREN